MRSFPRRQVCSIVLSIALSAGAAHAATLNVPAQFPTIQSAIAAAAPGDEIVVAPGTYAELLDFLGKSIVVRSSGGAGVTTISGGLAGPVVRFVSGEPAATRLEGFTITNGRVLNESGAGVRIIGASPTIVDCVITGNQATADCEACTVWGGGVSIDGGSPTLLRTTVSNNQVTVLSNAVNVGGGGLRVVNGTLTLTESLVVGNSVAEFFSGGGLFVGPGSGEAILNGGTQVNGNFAVSAVGGGVLVDGATLRVNDASFTGNYVEGGSGSAIEGISPVLIEIVDSTFTANEGRLGSSAAVNLSDGQLTVTNCVFDANTVDGGSGGAIGSILATTVITGTQFTNNVADAGAGGAVQAAGGSLTISSSTFTNNRAPGGSGGAIDASTVDVTITGSTFTGNIADGGSGGAINANDGTFSITGTNFSQNQAPGGTGAALVISSGSQVTISGSTFTQNGDPLSSDSALDSAASAVVLNNVTFTESRQSGVRIGGGSLQMNGGSVTQSDGTGIVAINAAVQIVGTSITGNTISGGSGGGAAITGGTFLIDRATFAGNTAPSGNGGGLVLRGAASGTVRATRFTGNGLDQGQGLTNGGAILAGNTVSATIANCIIENNSGRGGALRVLENANVTLVNTTANNNTLDVNHAFASITSSSLGQPATLTVNNSILRTDLSAGRVMFARSGTNTALLGSFSNVQGGLVGGTSIQTADPLFASPGTGNYALLASSPSIDAGSNALVPAGLTTDFAQAARVVRGLAGPGPATVDMGALEFQGASCYANCDGSTVAPVLNALDFSCFLSRYVAADPYANCDGSTTAPTLNALDFSCFLSQYRNGCP